MPHLREAVLDARNRVFENERLLVTALRRGELVTEVVEAAQLRELHGVSLTLFAVQLLADGQHALHERQEVVVPVRRPVDAREHLQGAQGFA